MRAKESKIATPWEQPGICLPCLPLKPPAHEYNFPFVLVPSSLVVHIMLPSPNISRSPAVHRTQVGGRRKPEYCWLEDERVLSSFVFKLGQFTNHYHHQYYHHYHHYTHHHHLYYCYLSHTQPVLTPFMEPINQDSGHTRLLINTKEMIRV